MSLRGKIREMVQRRCVEPPLHQQQCALVVCLGVARIKPENLRIYLNGFVPSGGFVRHPFLVEVAEIQVSVFEGRRKFNCLLKTGFGTCEIKGLRLYDTVKIVEIGISWELLERLREKLSCGRGVSFLDELLYLLDGFGSLRKPRTRHDR